VMSYKKELAVWKNEMSVLIKTDIFLLIIY
jgi:hypothetical protein